jgi:hypothetical protein
MQRSLLSRRSGITHVEVLVLIAVVLVVGGVVITAIQLVRERDARSRSANNLKLMSQAIANLSGIWGKVPAGYATFPGTAVDASHVSTTMQSWFFWILPFVEQDSGCRIPIKGPFQPYPVATYIAPLDPTNPGNTGANSYAVNARAFGGYTGDGTAGSPSGPRATYPSIFNLKGTSNTVTVFERYASLNGTWRGAPADNADGTCVLYGPLTDFGGAVKDPTFGLPPDDPNCTVTANGYSGGVVQVAMADGSSRTVTPSITTPYAGTTVWGWAISIGGPGGGRFGSAPPPAGW